MADIPGLYDGVMLEIYHASAVVKETPTMIHLAIPAKLAPLNTREMRLKLMRALQKDEIVTTIQHA